MNDELKGSDNIAIWNSARILTKLILERFPDFTKDPYNKSVESFCESFLNALTEYKDQRIGISLKLSNYRNSNCICLTVKISIGSDKYQSIYNFNANDLAMKEKGNESRT